MCVSQEEGEVYGTLCTFPSMLRHILQHLPDAQVTWTNLG